MSAANRQVPDDPPQSEATRPGGDRFYRLDGLRGIAALIVALYHLQAASGWQLPHAFMVVDVFFVMSGFVLACSHLEAARAGRLSLDRFMRLRLIRLYPTAFLGMLGAGVLMLAPILIHHKRSLTAVFEYGSAAVLGLVMIPFPVLVDSKVLFHLNIPMWSLFMELVMNFMLFLLLRQVAGAPRRALLLCAVVWIVAARGGSSAEVGPVWDAASLLGGLARTAYGLLLGGFLYVHRARFVTLADTRPAGIAALVLLLLLVTAPSLSSGVDPTFPLADFCFDFAAGLLGAPLIVALCLQPRRGPLAPLMLMLGRVSFPFFVFHIPILHALESLKVGERIPSPLGPGASTAVLTVVLSGLLSFAAAYAYEPAGQAWLRDRLLPGKPRPAGGP